MFSGVPVLLVFTKYKNLYLLSSFMNVYYICILTLVGLNGDGDDHDDDDMYGYTKWAISFHNHISENILFSNKEQRSETIMIA